MEIVAEHQAPRWASDTLALQSLWCAACLGDQNFSLAVGWLSFVMDRRRHGDLLPLPPGRLKDHAASAGLDESQRAFWIGQALNKLALHGPSNSVNHSVLRSNLPFTAGSG